MSFPKIESTFLRTDFEESLFEAKSKNDLKALWPKMMKTKFFVTGRRIEKNGKQDIELCPSANSTTTVVTISERREELQTVRGFEIVSLTGAHIVRRTLPGALIRVLLKDDAFEIAANRVEWLQKSLEASKQALLKKSEQKPETTSLPPVATVPETISQPAVVVKPQPQPQTKLMEAASGGDTLPPINAISIPLDSVLPEKPRGWDFRESTLRADTNVPGAHAPILAATPSFTYQSLEMQADISYGAAESFADADAADNDFVSRQISHTGLGVEFLIPSAWQEQKRERSIRVFDPNSSLQFEMNGRSREGLSFEDWMEMRLSIIPQEKPGLQRVSHALDVSAPHWQDKIIGKMVEFRGTIDGRPERIRFQILCLAMPHYFVAVSIEAQERCFAANLQKLKSVIMSIAVHEAREDEKVAVAPAKTESSEEPDEAAASSSQVRKKSQSTRGNDSRLKLLALGLLVLALIAVVFNFVL